ncbi:MAG: hypothetical protein NTU91_16915, partial [Chloroflexi bacterium]|nr:hypothetical protein [Chloroflexota bacterium]
ESPAGQRRVPCVPGRVFAPPHRQSCYAARLRRSSPRGGISFLLVGLALLFLASPGWSPQWLAVLVPLVLPNMPHPKGAVCAVAFTSAVILESPVSLSRGRFDALWITTAMQTLVLVVLTVDAWRAAQSESSASRGVGSE